jgi:hypothetical protein
MTYKNGQAGKSTREMDKKPHPSMFWIGLIGIVFVIEVWILLQNSKALEIVGIGILLLLVLIRFLLGMLNKQRAQKRQEEKPATQGESETEKDQPPQPRG